MIFLYNSWTFQPGDWLRQSPILVISKFCDTTRQSYGANCEYNSDILSVHSQSEKCELQLSYTTPSPFSILDLSSSVYYDKNMQSLINSCLPLSTPHPPIMIEEEDCDRESKGRVALPNWVNFRKGSKQPLTPTPQNVPYLWKSCACISYYPAIISPRIYATIWVIKDLQ